MSPFFDDDETIEIIQLRINDYGQAALEATSEAARLYWEAKKWLAREALGLRLDNRTGRPMFC